ncbi:carboxypeptidase regulatory-like domain-containing protein [Marinifilum fragile]|uniref:carboxypeptidase regulatory-like domain-containing protein n=1 Tax=Marinifilum fragile TaxID=570161 RepID=UPI002AAAC1E0|nr:carboxypeptidase regulatory-like domain-containing protein [Marinifilum fragile]
MKKFYTLFGLFIVFGIFMFVTSCNESTVEPDLYGSISGTVKASASNLPMEGVTITTNPGTTSVTTNAEGEFSIEKVLIGDYSVTATKEDYSSQSINIKVTESQNNSMSFILTVAPLDSKIPDDITYVSPADIEEDQSKLPTEVKLTWRNGETEKGDTLRFDVILYEGADDAEGTKVVSNILDTTYTVNNLKFETTYLWKVVARNKQLDEVEGKKWRFATEDFPTNPYLFVKDTLDSRDIYSWDLKENHLVQLTDGGGDELHPRIMPGSNSRIAYSAMKDGKFHIYTMDLKGKNVFQVTGDKPIEGNHNDGGGFVWSPTGDQLMYGHNNELRIINQDGTGGRKIANAPENREFTQMDWTYQFNNHSEGKILALAQGDQPFDNEIYLMDPDGSNMILLVDNLEGTLSNPQFSFGGDKVIFSLDTLYEDDRGFQKDARIYSINIDGTGWTDLSGDDKTGNDLQAKFSETGEKIIFMNVSNSGTEKKTIWTMDPDGSNREQLIFNGEMPDWYNP